MVRHNFKKKILFNNDNKSQYYLSSNQNSVSCNKNDDCKIIDEEMTLEVNFSIIYQKSNKNKRHNLKKKILSNKDQYDNKSQYDLSSNQNSVSCNKNDRKIIDEEMTLEVNFSIIYQKSNKNKRHNNRNYYDR